MQLDYTLSECLVDKIVCVKDLIINTNYWSDLVYQHIQETIRSIRIDVNASFRKQSGQPIEEAIRQMAQGTFEGDLKLLTDHLNAYLFLYKLQQRVEWHRRYGNFPEEYNIK